MSYVCDDGQWQFPANGVCTGTIPWGARLTLLLISVCVFGSCESSTICDGSFRRIENGMTVEKVEQILGPGKRISAEAVHNPRSQATCLWRRVSTIGTTRLPIDISLWRSVTAKCATSPIGSRHSSLGKASTPARQRGRIGGRCVGSGAREEVCRSSRCKSWSGKGCPGVQLHRPSQPNRRRTNPLKQPNNAHQTTLLLLHRPLNDRHGGEQDPLTVRVRGGDGGGWNRLPGDSSITIPFIFLHDGSSDTT